MAGGKQSKRRRAAGVAPPPVRTPRRRQASGRVLGGAAALLVLIVLGIVLGFAFSGNGGSSTSKVLARGSLVNGLPGAADVERLLDGIPQHGNVLGSPAAPATLVEYVDLQCPFCQQFETQAMPSLIKNYVRTGKAKVELRPIAFIGPDSELGRSGAIAAARQNKMFNFTQLLYLNQGAENSGWLNTDLVAAAAASIPGVDVHRLIDQSSSAATRGLAASYDRLATRDHIVETPTILVGKSGQMPRKVSLQTPGDAGSVASALDRATRTATT